MECDTLAKGGRLKNVVSKTIVDDVLLYVIIANQLLEYFKTVLNFLKHHHAKLKLKNIKLFQERCKFLGINVAEGETQPAQSKNEAFAKLERPNTWGDLRILI